MGFTVKLDQSRCVGNANCSYRAPHAFRLTDEGVSEVVDPEADLPENLRLAEEECPAQAIEVVEDA